LELPLELHPPDDSGSLVPTFDATTSVWAM